MALPEPPAAPSTDRRGAGSTTRLAALLEAAPDALVCVEPSGRIAQLNQRVGELFGYDRDELLGAEVEVLLPEAMRDRHVAPPRRLQRATRRCGRWGRGCRWSPGAGTGREIPVEVSLVPWLAGEQGWVIAAIRDVTEQRALEAASAESEARLRQIAESVDLVFLLLQLDPPAYLYVSPKARRLIGIDSESLVDADLTHAMRAGAPRRPATRWSGASWSTRGRGCPAESEHRLLTEDGEVRWVRAVATPVHVPDGPPERTVITMEDITDRVLVRRGAAHRRGRGPCGQRLQEPVPVPDEPRAAHAAERRARLRPAARAASWPAPSTPRRSSYVLKGGQHLLDLINDVLDISRIESGEMSLSLETMNLAALVDETLQLMRPLASAAEVTLLRRPSGDPAVMLLADRQRVRQILLNLLSNAMKYNKDGRPGLGGAGRSTTTWCG